MRVAVTYSRVSTERQSQQGQSMAQQLEAMRAYCKFHELRIVKHCSDPGKSGRKLAKRPGLGEALDIVCQSQGVLLCYKLDRVVRSAGDCEQIVERLNAAGAKLCSVTESLDTSTATGRAFMGVTAVWARMESEKTGERIRDANAYTVSTKGYRTNGIQPAGFTIDHNGERAPVKCEQRLIDLLRKTAKYWGPGKIAAGLNRFSVPTIRELRGQPRPKNGWTCQVVQRILARMIA